ncbi:hypothetical protein A2154_02390 [Candidatus Gottesmanbacteria bacterium RBG_16_43_7]|uniref:Serine hydroxymethyltransferase n=1 Tax=Candidatus Gottesmanbacteria bacterium RBG_16_43_7 TaxID=1798373 RepID=A0A1F5ZBQ3_9BACT|nr:MAG: hypothetical protein A2154_02390 [Candidatus Gottesmanbacteria bacterium RBG_16_43_7]
MRNGIDSKIKTIILQEQHRQRTQLSLIPSENYASKAVRSAVGSVLMNKYAEGQAGKRYYQGNKNIDEIEKWCKIQALNAFGLNDSVWSVNVQALSGSPANLEAISALLLPGERIMSMFLPDGGHLSHGWQVGDKKVTLVSKIWDVHFYYVEKKSRVFDYDQIARQAKAVKPKLLISGGTAYAREIDHRKMSLIAKSVGSYYLADIAHEAGLVAAGVNSSPFPYSDVVTMTTHKTLRGPRGALIFSRKAYSERIDQSVFPGLQGGPHMHTIAGIAVALTEAQTPDFKKYAQQMIKNAQVLASEFIKAGLDVVSGGTDKHLVLLDLRPQKLSAWIVAWALEYANIIVNRNTVPFETGTSFYPSGIRLGTPAVTTRGMLAADMKKIAGWIMEVLKSTQKLQIPQDKVTRAKFLKSIHPQLKKNSTVISVGQKVRQFAAKFPVP